MEKERKFSEITTICRVTVEKLSTEIYSRKTFGHLHTEVILLGIIMLTFGHKVYILMSFLSLQDGVHKGNKIDFEQPSSTIQTTHTHSV